MINITEILKEKSAGTKLWSPIFGTVYLREVYKDCVGNNVIDIDDAAHVTWGFAGDGRFNSVVTDGNKNGETMLFPSKKMKDWSKFAWKEGDFLGNVTDKFFPKIVVFKKFVDEDYSTFESTCGLTVETKLAKYSIQSTLSYCKMKNEDSIRIAKEKIDELLREEEVANSPDHTFQPFDKVLVRDHESSRWVPTFFTSKGEKKRSNFPYETLSGCYAQCIPYNEKTKHLLGTTEPYKED